MKRLICFFLIVFVLFSVFSVSSAEYPLSDKEKKFLGCWNMFANNGKGKIYNINIVFLDNMIVVQKSLTFENGKLSSDNIASGEWSGFTDNTVIFTLAGNDMTAMIKDDGYLYLYFFDDFTLCGICSRCPDMTEVLGW